MNLLFAPKISYLKERDKNTQKSFSSQAACVTIAALMQYFLMAAFCWMLIEAIYLYLFVVKVYNINAKMHMYYVLSWGKFIILQHAQVTITMHQCFRIAKTGVVIHCSVCISFLSLWVGLPVIMVAISLGIAAGKEGLQSYTSDK